MATAVKGAPKERKDVYEIVTENIIKQLEQGTVPWQKPWATAGIPMNLISKRSYRGINLLLLASLGYEQNYFLTYKKLKEIGGTLKPQQRSHIVVFVNVHEVEQQGEEPKTIPFLRYYTVYNIEQCRDIPEDLLPKKISESEKKPIESCENILADMPQRPVIQHKEQSAWYNPIEDKVNMPKKNTFIDSESYYCTLFHELVHSTGHISRLNRKGLLQMAEFGSEPYSHEELVAEMGASYLLSVAGITQQFEQNAAYMQEWLKKLRNDKRFIFSAASHAQKAADFILNVQPTTEEEHT